MHELMELHRQTELGDREELTQSLWGMRVMRPTCAGRSSDKKLKRVGKCRVLAASMQFMRLRPHWKP